MRNISLNKIAHSTFLLGAVQTYSATRCKTALRTIFFQTLVLCLTARKGMVIKMIEKIADRVIYGNDRQWEMNIENFDWVPGVGLYGIWKAYKATGKRKYMDFLIGWANRHIDEAKDAVTINSSAPMLTIAELYHETGNEQYLNACLEAAEYIVGKAPLTACGGLEHTVTEDVPAFRQQIWADTLFMAVLFVAKLGKYTQNQAYTDFAVNQLKIHLKYLSDGSGLFCHGYSCITENHLSGIHWGRANAWIIYSACEIVELLGEFDGIDEVKEYIKKHVIALSKLQRKTGGFATVLDCEDSYTEISATAGISAGIKAAQRLGIVNDYDEMCKLAENIVSQSVNGNGEVMHVSTGTPIMKNIHEYMDIPCRHTLYGQALSILALI